uniref:HAT C-terminal dimerisation domain-containing protein n=1 Tax=Aegilops tauschii subsp. strangulata TaxID=200361 RepID=A0A452YAD7_AEGTS
MSKIGKSKLLCEGTLLHMCCCAHILNLVVKDGLDAMKSAIENIRESVAYWTASPKRIETFEDMAKYNKVKITRKLRLDCKTRWNSTFIMLDIALPYRLVFERLKEKDKQYEWLPSSEEWAFATDVVERLRLFYEVTELFSGTGYVTTNVYFPKICEIKMKMRQWETSSNEIVQNMTKSMAVKFDKYWSDIQGLMAIATLLDPRYTKQMLVACFAMLHGIEPSCYECTAKVDDIVASLHSLLDHYEVESEAYKPDEESILSTMKAPAIMSVFQNSVAQQMPATARLQGEIEQYLNDGLVPYTEKFNVLDWWKVAGTRYATLRKVARDIFGIPVTIVASESAFSTGGRKLKEHRSRLTSDMVEVLMCSQDWLRNKYKDAYTGEASFWTCLQDIQEGIQDLAV